ncbi:MAG TPA: autotransporter assembly complex family protein [Phenylobacterium sp.]|nr:autotransporter assembly complex family protein [Phenylobacterium sp.]
MGRLLYAVAAAAALCVAGHAPQARAAQPRAAVEGDLDAGLRAEIIRAIGDSDRPIDNRFEARRRADGAAQDALAVLRSEGYYAAVVEPQLGEGDSPAPAVRITPGVRFILAAPAIEWVGAAPDPDTVAGAAGALALSPGAPGRAADVVAAEGRAVAAVQKRGYADVKAEPREVVVDHADRTVRPTYRLAAGPLSRLDGIKLTTNGRTRPSWLQHLGPWKPGDLYQPADVAQLERRLLDTGVYDTVTVGLAPQSQTTPDGLRPVVVSLAERRRRTISLGASYGTNEGPGADVTLTNYDVLGRADTLSLFARASKLDSRTGADLSLPHWLMADQTLSTELAAYKTTTDAYDATGFGGHADAQRHFTKTSYLTLGVSLDFSRTEELKPGTLTSLGRDIATLGTLAELALDRSNDPLNPTRGWRVSARAEPTLLAGKGTVPYLKVQTQGSIYWPLDAQAETVVAARLHLGSILNGTVGDIPAPQRFYAGGGGSVRGFAYQAVGPRLPDNTPQGGLSLGEASVELRHQLTQKWGLVGFVDAGLVGDRSLPAVKDLGVGAGVGVRYNLGFGPIRLDVAAPVAGRRGGAPFEIYVSIGQAF